MPKPAHAAQLALWKKARGIMLRRSDFEAELLHFYRRVLDRWEAIAALEWPEGPAWPLPEENDIHPADSHLTGLTGAYKARLDAIQRDAETEWEALIKTAVIPAPWTEVAVLPPR